MVNNTLDSLKLIGAVAYVAAAALVVCAGFLASELVHLCTQAAAERTQLTMGALRGALEQMRGEP